MSDDTRMITAFKAIADALEPFEAELQARLLASMTICLGREKLVTSKIDAANRMFRPSHPDPRGDRG